MRRVAVGKASGDCKPIQLRARLPAPSTNLTKDESLRTVRDARPMDFQDLKERTITQTKLHENPDYECMSYNMIQLLELMDQK